MCIDTWQNEFECRLFCGWVRDWKTRRLPNEKFSCLVSFAYICVLFLGMINTWTKFRLRTQQMKKQQQHMGIRIDIRHYKTNGRSRIERAFLSRSIAFKVKAHSHSYFHSSDSLIQKITEQTFKYLLNEMWFIAVRILVRPLLKWSDILVSFWEVLSGSFIWLSKMYHDIVDCS